MTSDPHHLQDSDVFLPPEVLLHLRAQGRQQVVRVHDDVDEGVEQAEESAVATCGAADNARRVSEPGDGKRGTHAI